MRDSPLKRFLVMLHFNVCQIYRGLTSIRGYPQIVLENMDYDSYWQKTNHLTGIQPRYRIIAQKIGYGDSVLDVGCGDGELLLYLKQTKNTRELGIDISEIAVKRAASRGLNVQKHSFFDLLKDNKYDHVIMSEMIEHVVNPEDYVREVFKLAKKSLIITFPNIAYWPYRLRLLFGRFPVQWVYHPSEHLHFWSIPDFRYWVTHSNLFADNADIDFCPSNGITLCNLHKLLPNLFGWQIVVFIRKQKDKCVN